MQLLLRYKKILALIAVTLFLIWAMTTTVKPREQASFPERLIGYVVLPIQKGFNYIGVQLTQTYEFFQEIGAVKGEKERLSLRVQNLENELRQLNDIKKENVRLKEMLNLKEEYKQPVFESAQVIGRDPENWNSIIQIDKGSSNGIAVNSTVVSANKGLVGRVIQVAPTWSKVMLITDSDSSVSCIVDRTRDLTVVRGDLDASKKGFVKLSYILPDTDIVVGDVIVTSGFGGVFPKGFLVGKVKEVRLEQDQLTKYAYIEPAADFRRIEEVFVTKGEVVPTSSVKEGKVQ